MRRRSLDVAGVMTRKYKKRCRIALTAAERPVIWPAKFSSCRARTYQHADSVRASSRANGNPSKPMTRAMRGNSPAALAICRTMAIVGFVAGRGRNARALEWCRSMRNAAIEPQACTECRRRTGARSVSHSATARRQGGRGIKQPMQVSDGFACRRYHGGPMPLLFALRCCVRESDELSRYDGWSHQPHRLRRDACGDGRSLRQYA